MTNARELRDHSELVGKTALVTGADGFIGSHLTEALVRIGAEVRALCFYNSQGTYGWLDRTVSEIRAQIDFRLGDIRDGRLIEEACRGVDTVFHLAALIAIPYSYAAPESFVDTNVRGTLNVLMAARRTECRRVVHTSTSEVYGTPATVPITEDHPLRAQSPYSATKIAADKLAESFHHSYALPVVTVRPFNTYGPRQSARAVIPTILSQLLSGKSTIELGNLAPRRDFTFVADTVEGLIRSGTALNVEGETIQLGTGKTTSIAELFDVIARVLGSSAEITVAEDRLRPPDSEVMVLQADATKARELLGWEPRVTLPEGVRRTALWMKESLSLYDPDTYSV